MVEKIPVRISTEGNPPDRTVHNQITKKDFNDYVKRKWTDPAVHTKVIQYFSKYPANTLNQIMKNLDDMVYKITTEGQNG